MGCGLNSWENDEMEWRTMIERLEEIRKILEPYVSACEVVRRDCNAKKTRRIIETPLHNEVRTIEHSIDMSRNHIDSLSIERKRLMIEYIASSMRYDDLRVTTTFNDKRLTMTASVTVDLEDDLDQTLERSLYQLGGGLNRVTISPNREKLDAIALINVELRTARDHHLNLHHQLQEIQAKLSAYRDEVIENEYLLKTEELRTEDVKDALNELTHIAAEWNSGKGAKCEACGNVKRMSDSLTSIGTIQEHLLTSEYGLQKLCPN